MTLFYFLRHAETDWNKEERLQGHEDVSLNEMGRRQALSVRELIYSLPIDMCFSSPSSRAYETALLVMDGHPRSVGIRCLNDLRERDFGRMSGKTGKEIDEDKIKNPHLYIKLEDKLFPIDGESVDSFQDRVQNIIELIHSLQSKTCLLVTHGGFIRQTLRTLLSSEIAFQADNAGLYKVYFINGSWGFEQIKKEKTGS